MKKSESKTYWYRIDQQRGPDGKYIRSYVVQCRRCQLQGWTHASGMTDDAMRKWFIRHGWDIGRRPKSHLCPECQQKPKKPTSSIIPLDLNNKSMGSGAGAEASHEWQHGSHIDSMPQQSNEQAAQVADEIEPDQPAEWWLELQKR